LIPFNALAKYLSLFKKRIGMWLAQTSDYLVRNANEVCFSLAMLISVLFFRQYKKYEEEAEKEEMIEGFLCD
jgi:hypothetical protein